MGQPPARLGDKIGHGIAEGEIISASSDIYVEGPSIARIGDMVICHHIDGGAEHGIQTIVGGSSGINTGGPPIARIGDMISCGATILTGASDVIVD